MQLDPNTCWWHCAHCSNRSWGPRSARCPCRWKLYSLCGAALMMGAPPLTGRSRWCQFPQDRSWGSACAARGPQWCCQLVGRHGRKGQLPFLLPGWQRSPYSLSVDTLLARSLPLSTRSLAQRGCQLAAEQDQIAHLQYVFSMRPLLKNKDNKWDIYVVCTFHAQLQYVFSMSLFQ